MTPCRVQTSKVWSIYMCVVISIYDSQSYLTMQFIKQWKLQSLNADEHRAHLWRPDYFSYQLDSSLVFCPSPGFLSLLFKLLAALICDRAFTFSLHLVVCHHRWQGGDLVDQSAASPLCVNKQRHRAVTSFHLLLTPSHLWDVTESDNVTCKSCFLCYEDTKIYFCLQY